MFSYFDITLIEETSSHYHLLLPCPPCSCNEMDSTVVDRLVTLVYDLISEGALNLARLLRRKFLEKYEQKVSESVVPLPLPAPAIEVSTTAGDLLSFKSHDIAEQMTLLDSTLFQKIEVRILSWQNAAAERNISSFV